MFKLLSVYFDYYIHSFSERMLFLWQLHISQINKDLPLKPVIISLNFSFPIILSENQHYT